jgi:hypothetical protein
MTRFEQTNSPDPLINLELFSNPSEFWAAATTRRAEGQRHCRFNQRSVPRIIQLFASLECGFVRQFDSNNGGRSAAAFSISTQRSNNFRMSPICHGHPARPVAYYLEWRDSQAN